MLPSYTILIQNLETLSDLRKVKICKATIIVMIEMMEISDKYLLGR